MAKGIGKVGEMADFGISFWFTAKSFALFKAGSAQTIALYIFYWHGGRGLLQVCLGCPFLKGHLTAQRGV